MPTTPSNATFNALVSLLALTLSSFVLPISSSAFSVSPFLFSLSPFQVGAMITNKPTLAKLTSLLTLGTISKVMKDDDALLAAVKKGAYDTIQALVRSLSLSLFLCLFVCLSSLFC
jgi:hypothetical protein